MPCPNLLKRTQKSSPVTDVLRCSIELFCSGFWKERHAVVERIQCLSPRRKRKNNNHDIKPEKQ